MTVDRTSAPAPGSIRPFRFPAMDREALDSGLAVLSARHGTMPLVTAVLVVDGGAEAEAAGHAGLAHLTARALETGTTARSADRLALELERLGIEFAANASWDAAVLSLTVPGDRLERALAYLAEIACSPVFPEREVERLRDQQLADILQRRTEPRSLAGEAAARFFHAPDVPYARTVQGTAVSVERLDREIAGEFYRRRYRPGALLLVGDIDAADAAAAARRHFGEWRPGPAEAVTFHVRPRSESTTIFLVDRPGAVQSEIRVGHVGVDRHHPDYFALLVMNAILGGAFTSRLNLTLRERLGYTYGVQSRFVFRRRPGPFLIQTAVATDVTANAIRETLREIRGLQHDGASEDEVAAARDYIAGVLPLQLQTTEQLAGRLADLVVYGLPDDYFHHFRERIAAVTPADVLRVAREHIRADALAVVVVGDAASVESPLAELDIGPVEKYRSDFTPCT